MKTLRSFGFFVTTLAIYLIFPLVGWGIGDCRGFLSLWQRSGYAVLIVILGLAVGFQAYGDPSGIRGSKGQAGKLTRRQSVVRVVITLLLFAALFFLPFADRRSIGVMVDTPVIRWIGLGLFGLGIILVFWSGIALGKLYSAEVTIQKDHHLITSGLYRYIRHPRYLGGIMYAVGLSLLFRSWIGLSVTVLSIPVFLFRIKDEEELMHEAFGSEWETYRKRSWRLIPFLF